MKSILNPFWCACRQIHVITKHIREAWTTWFLFSQYSSACSSISVFWHSDSESSWMIIHVSICPTLVEPGPCSSQASEGVFAPNLATGAVIRERKMREQCRSAHEHRQAFRLLWVILPTLFEPIELNPYRSQSESHQHALFQIPVGWQPLHATNQTETADSVLVYYRRSRGDAWL